jgi:hypothetical protein
MSVRFVQASESQHLDAEARSRRRSLPPSLSVSVSQSVNQRWRERPRCPARRVTPGRRDGVVHAIVGRAVCRCLRAQVVHDETRWSRARVRVQIRRDEAADEPHRNWLARIPTRPGGNAAFADPDLAVDHRAFHAGAVLTVVNALRFASTRPAAGPSGIDDASARHDVGYCAMAGFLMTRAGREKRVDAGFPQAYVDVSRLCPTAHPPHRTQCMQSAFPVVASGHDSSAPPQHRVRLHAVTLRVSRRT